VPSNRPWGVTTIHSPPSSREISVKTSARQCLYPTGKYRHHRRPDASRLESGLKSSESMLDEWPVSVRSSRCVATSQILMVLSVLLDASRRPSRLKATRVTPLP